jgi:rhodanese-related sulfurtransferase
MRLKQTPRVTIVALLVLAATALVGVATAGCSSGASSTTQTSEAQSTTSEAAPVTYVTVDVQQAFDALSANKDAQIVDVREPDEWTTTGVPVGAVLIPLGQLEQRAPAELAKDKPVYVICNSGNRSRTGSDILLKLGYAEVFNVAGGIQAWLKAGLAVETYKP